MERVDIKRVYISRVAVVLRAADFREIILRHPVVRIPKDGAVQIAMRERTDPRDQDERILIWPLFGGRDRKAPRGLSSGRLFLAHVARFGFGRFGFKKFSTERRTTLASCFARVTILIWKIVENCYFFRDQANGGFTPTRFITIALRRSVRGGPLDGEGR